MDAEMIILCDGVVIPQSKKEIDGGVAIACPAMCRNTPTKSVLNLSFPVKRAISKCSSTIPRMAVFTTMSFGKMKQNKKERHLYE